MMSVTAEFTLLEPTDVERSETMRLSHRAESSMALYSDLGNTLIQKRWGTEYQVFGNSTVGIWLLQFANCLPTSLHCHPRTKTSLLVVRGEIELGLIDKQVCLGSGEGIIFEKGVYHSLKASPDVLVVEAMYPPNRGDLLRLHDSMGRDLRVDGAHAYEYGASIEVLTPGQSAIQFNHVDNSSRSAFGRTWSVGSRQFHATRIQHPCEQFVAISVTTPQFPLITGDDLLGNDSIRSDDIFFAVGFPADNMRNGVAHAEERSALP